MIGTDIDKKETKQVLKVEFLKELLKEMANPEEFKDDKDLIENYLIVENDKYPLVGVIGFNHMVFPIKELKKP